MLFKLFISLFLYFIIMYICFIFFSFLFSSGRGIRTPVVRLMRPSWNHSSPPRDMFVYMFYFLLRSHIFSKSYKYRTCLFNLNSESIDIKEVENFIFKSNIQTFIKKMALATYSILVMNKFFTICVTRCKLAPSLLLTHNHRLDYDRLNL